jgi:hypothetical protein
MVLLLAACGSDSSGATSAGQPATIYSNASLKGNYSCILQGVNTLPSGENVNVHAVATFSANGKGTITASKKVAVLSSKDGTYATCNYLLASGTYTLNSNGAGSWNLEYTADTGNDSQHCIGTQENSGLAAGAGGKEIYVSPVMGSTLVLGGACEAM